MIDGLPSCAAPVPETDGLRIALEREAAALDETRDQLAAILGLLDGIGDVAQALRTSTRLLDGWIGAYHDPTPDGVQLRSILLLIRTDAYRAASFCESVNPSEFRMAPNEHCDARIVGPPALLPPS